MIIWPLLIICAYLLGSVPAAYLVARSHGVDLRQQGTSQAGGGNVWRTTSRKLGLMVGAFDFLKGLMMVWVAQLQGLDMAQQIFVGLATVVGHNWPVFLRFHGGRGAATTLGIIMIIPAINGTTPWPLVITLAIVMIGTVIFRSSPLPIFIAAASLPITNWTYHGDINTTLAFLAIFLVISIKRLMAQPSTVPVSVRKRRVLLNRLLFDRDIMDRKAWMYRKPTDPQDIFDDTG
ncbi:glycerol-3-phosphate acyltransferase [Chloroflexota bacterium]